MEVPQITEEVAENIVKYFAPKGEESDRARFT